MPLCLCSRRWQATVEVISRRGMKVNLTAVSSYLNSLHSRFCFKGFVYTWPINQLLGPIFFSAGNNKDRPNTPLKHFKPTIYVKTITQKNCSVILSFVSFCYMTDSGGIQRVLGIYSLDLTSQNKTLNVFQEI